MSQTPLFRDPNNHPGRTSATVGKRVTLTRSHGFARQGGFVLSWGLLIALTCLMPARAFGQSSANQNPATVWDQRPSPTRVHAAPSISPDDTPPPLTDKRRALLKANFEKTKTDAAEMATLAKELRTALDKPNADAYSLQVVNLADKIEKLAKKIRGEMQGY